MFGEQGDINKLDEIATEYIIGLLADSAAARSKSGAAYTLGLEREYAKLEELRRGE